MNKRDLEQYVKKREELNVISDEINYMITKYKECSTVVGSDIEYPYCTHHIKVWGVPLTNMEFKDKLKRYRKKRNELIKLLAEVETFIDTIDDSEIKVSHFPKYQNILEGLIRERGKRK